MSGYVFGQHDGFTTALPISRVGAGVDVEKSLMGPLAAFGGLEASVGRGSTGAWDQPSVRALGGVRFHF